MGDHDDINLIDYDDDLVVSNTGATSTNSSITLTEDKKREDFSLTGFRYFSHLHIMLDSLKKWQRFYPQARAISGPGN